MGHWPSIRPWASALNPLVFSLPLAVKQTAAWWDALSNGVRRRGFIHGQMRMRMMGVMRMRVMGVMRMRMRMMG